MAHRNGAGEHLMAAIPYMPFYIADYLADAAHLTTLEHGAYLLLIMNYWQTGKSLPNDDIKLSRIVKLRLDQWTKIKFIILEFFFVTDKELQHLRIEKELSIFRIKSELARVAGQKSGEKRRENKRTDVERTLNGRRTDVERTLNHTDTDTDTDTEILLTSDEVNCDSSADDSLYAETLSVKKLNKSKPCPHADIVAMYHRLCPVNPPIYEWTKNRQTHLKARWRDYDDIRWWELFFNRIAESKFLTGRTTGKDGRSFLPGLDWCIKPENFAKILEGRYDDE